MATVSTDRGVGFAVLFTLLGFAGALVAFAAGLVHYQLAAGWGFAAAMIASAIVIAAIHLA
ncbi:MAG TPA: hypothetical protein VFJ06_10495 [Halococcus sp.]|nr:hypothetical protein [Halococcus sp.]